jgi:hypothetical protein
MIAVVSGLPRSGTSMMMQMIAAGGLPPVTDAIRSSDGDNPRGYYELEAVKKTKEDDSWLTKAEGGVVKVISKLLYDLPPTHEYRVVFMSRDLDEVLKSQMTMLKNLGKSAGSSSDASMKAFFEEHIRKLKAWLMIQPNMKVLYCDYKVVVGNPFSEAARVAGFLGVNLNMDAMRASVDDKLYRNKA